MNELPVPSFYDPADANEWSYAPDQRAVFEAAQVWQRVHALPPAGSDRSRVHLLLVDLQKDFCFPRGSLYVSGHSGRGALDDNDRIARFIYRNLACISEITCTLDTHLPFQIFFSSFWRDNAGHPLGAHREVTADDVRSGRVRPDPAMAAFTCGGNEAWLRRQVEFYCTELERGGKYRLYLWPPHCLLGSDGHPLAGVVHAARLFHAWSRRAANLVEIKGGHLLTENYSVLAPEVLRAFDGSQIARRNTAFVERLLEADAIVIAGQAASHCVRNTLDDLLLEISRRDRRLTKKVYVLRDCMSAVVVPDRGHADGIAFDFTPQAEAALERFAAAGMHIVDAESRMRDWPELSLK